MATDAKQELVRANLRTMRAEYAGKLLGKLHELEATWQLLGECGWDVTHMQALHRQVHRLHGSGAIYGFAALSAAAQPLDVQVGKLAGRAMPPTTHETAELGKLVDGLRTAVVQCLRAVADEPAEL